MTRTVRMEDFAIVLDKELIGALSAIDEGLEPATRKACKKGAKTARSKVKEQAKAKVHHPEYAKTLSYKVVSSTSSAEGEIGSRKYPGLVHLLEFGHACMGGKRTRPIQHMAPAADDAFQVFEKEIGRVVDTALEGVL